MIGASEAKRKFFELVTRASKGEEIGIMREGKLVALLVPVPAKADVSEIFAAIEEIRSRSRLPENAKFKDLIAEGRS